MPRPSPGNGIRGYRGVHYRFSNEAGEELGRKVAEMALAKVMRPLPGKGRER